jgi:hypothetical protein
MEYVYDIFVNGIRKETHDRYEKAVNAYLEFCDQEPLAKIAVEITAPNGFHIVCNTYNELEAEGETHEYSQSMKVDKEDFFDSYALKHATLGGYVAHKAFNCTEIPLDVPVHPMFCEKKPDAINPSHYKDVVPGMQYMEMMVHMLPDVESHILGQVYKYLMRNGKKDEELQELKKAQWYLNALVNFKEQGKVIV